MELGVVTDLPSTALACSKAGASFVILCGHLKTAAGGVTPSLGQLNNCVNLLSSQRTSQPHTKVEPHCPDEVTAEGLGRLGGVASASATSESNQTVRPRARDEGTGPKGAEGKEESKARAETQAESTLVPEATRCDQEIRQLDQVETPTQSRARLGGRTTATQLYALIRPIVGTFKYDEDAKRTLLADVEAFAQVEGLRGVMVACEGAEGVLDQELAAKIVKASGDLEVWYHRGSVLLREGYETELKSAGFEGVVHGLLGDTVEVMVENAINSMATLERVGLKCMICGSVPASHVGYVGKKLEGYAGRKTLRGWCVTVAEDDGWYGALLPWRTWEVSSSVWPGAGSPAARGSGPETVKRMMEALPDDLGCGSISGCSTQL